MTKLVVPTGYKSRLNLYETQIAIGQMKRLFEDNLSKVLNLKRVSAPLFVEPHTGINDDLDGVQQPVDFVVRATNDAGSFTRALSITIEAAAVRV